MDGNDIRVTFPFGPILIRCISRCNQAITFHLKFMQLAPPMIRWLLEM